MFRWTKGSKVLIVYLTYMEWVVIDCAYGYFRPHMNRQWRAICSPIIKRKRTAKSKKETRDRLLWSFFSEYSIKSKIVAPEHLETVNVNEMSANERKELNSLEAVQGGTYHQQVDGQDRKTKLLAIKP